MKPPYEIFGLFMRCLRNGNEIYLIFSTFEAQSDYWQTRQEVFDVASLLNNQEQGRGFRKYSIIIHMQIIDNS